MTDKEINEAVARKLGWKQDYYPESGLSPHIKFWFKPWHKSPDNLPDFCHSIEAAFKVWDKMSEQYFLTLETEAGDLGRNIVKIWRNDRTAVGWVIEDVYADTAPMAICLAFLKLEDK